MDLGSREIHSNETALLVDSEVRAFIHEAHETAKAILKQHYELMDIMAKALLDKETLGTEEIFELVLANCPPEELELVQKKYARAREMRFEHSDSLDQDEIAEEAETASETVPGPEAELS